MKVKLFIERYDGAPISTYEMETEIPEEGKYAEVICTASMADYGMTEGLSWEEIVKVFGGRVYQGVRFKARIEP